MPSPRLATKLFIPSAVKSLVVRHRLLEKLDKGFSQTGCRLALVSAPPGFGKTTLVSTWVAGLKTSGHQPPPLASWLSLDVGDNDPANFWAYLISALQTAQAGIGKQASSLLQAGSPPDLEGVIVSLVNDLVRVTNPFLLVLDDYHHIRNPDIHDSLTFFIEHTPPGFQLLILSRADPPLPLALLRGRGQLLEIRPDELRFSNEEAVAYLNEGMKLLVPPDDIETLNAKTEGWAAGLQMAAIALQLRLSAQGGQPASQFIESFSGSNRYILDYLLEEVLNRQPENVQEFLLRTSILDRLCGPLCDAVLDGTVDARHQLEQLEKANLFLIPLDQERVWFRYHHLFADILRAKLDQVSPRQAPVLQKRAADWFEKNGMLEEAISYTHAAQDHENLVRLIEQSIHPMIQIGRIIPLTRWARLLPENIVLERPWLCLLSAWLLLSKAEYEKGAYYLDRTEELIRQLKPGKEADEILGIAYSLRTQVLEINGDIPGTIKKAQQALELLDPNNIITRSSVDYSLGRAYYDSGDLERADQVWSEFIRMAMRARIQSIYAIVMSVRANLLSIQGKLGEAIDTCSQAISYMLANDIDRFILSGSPYASLGMLSLIKNNLVEAEKYMDEGMKQNRAWGNLNALAIGYAYQGRLRIAQGNLDAAQACLLETEKIDQRYTLYFDVRSQYLSCRVRLYLAQGDVQAAARIIKEDGISPDDPLSFKNEGDHITLARALIAQGRHEESEGLLRRLAGAAEAGGRFGRLIEISYLRAIALQAMGRGNEAIQALETSLKLAEPEGYIRNFVDEGEPMAKLLAIAIQKGVLPEYANLLLSAFPGARLRLPEEKNIHKQDRALIEPLSEREVEVLQLLAAGLANKEIAQRLFISVRTVKFHTTGIYSKLGVKGRHEACERARQLRLLE